MYSQRKKEQPEFVAERILGRAKVRKVNDNPSPTYCDVYVEYFLQVVRKLQTRLSLAQFKVEHGLQDLSFDLVELKVQRELQNIKAVNSRKKVQSPRMTSQSCDKHQHTHPQPKARVPSSTSMKLNKSFFFGSSDLTDEFHAISSVHNSGDTGHLLEIQSPKMASMADSSPLPGDPHVWGDLGQHTISGGSNITYATPQPPVDSIIRTRVDLAALRNAAFGEPYSPSQSFDFADFISITPKPAQNPWPRTPSAFKLP